MEYINDKGYAIKDSIFHINDTHVAYPIIVSDTDSERAKVWNQIILEDIDRILKIYADYTIFPSPQDRDLYQESVLRITYDIKRNDSRYLSIFYTASFYSPYAPHPTRVVYTTNIDKESNKRIMLSDLIPDADFFADNISKWDIVTKDDEPDEYSQAVRDYIEGLGKKVLQMGFISADIIGSDNYLGIFSYLKPDKLGISIAVPTYLGDHVEFEKDFY